MKIIRVLASGNRRRIKLYTRNITKILLALRTIRKQSVNPQSVMKAVNMSHTILDGVAQWFQGIMSLLDKRKTNFNPVKLIKLFTDMMESMAKFKRE